MSVGLRQTTALTRWFGMIMSDPMWEHTQIPSGNCLRKPHIAELCSNESEPTVISKSGRPLHEWYICVNCRTWYPDPTVAEVPGRDLTPGLQAQLVPCVSSRRRCKILSHVRAGSTGEFESSRDVRLTILIVAKDSLDPVQPFSLY
jgi:hypothetical protein